MALKSRYSPLSKPNFENLYNAFTGLTPRDQLIAAVVACLLMVLLVILPISMISGKVSGLRKGLTRSQDKAHEVMKKVAEYEGIQAEISALEKKYGRGVAAMTSTVESLVRKAKLAGNIEALKEKPPVPGDRFSELPVELRLKKVTLEQLLDLIRSVETFPKALLRVRNLQVKPGYKNRAYLSVSMDIANIKLEEEG